MWKILENRWARRFFDLHAAGGIVWQAITSLPTAIVGGISMIVGLLAYLDDYGYVAIAAAVLATALLASLVLLVLVNAWVKWANRGGPKDAPSMPAGGDTFSATGTVSDPPPFEPRGLYAGDIRAIDDRLISENVLILQIYVFNATGVRVRFSEIDEKLPLYLNDGQQDIKEMLPQAAFAHKTEVGPLSEGMVSIEQRVPSDVSKLIDSALQAGRVVKLKVEQLKIVATDCNDPSRRIELLLIGGLDLSRSPEFLNSRRSQYLSGTVQLTSSMQFRIG